MKRTFTITTFAGCLLFALTSLTSCGGGGGGGGSDAGPNGNVVTDAVVRWNELLLEAGRVDHTPVSVGEGRIFGECFGPVAQGRAATIVSIAVADAVARISGEFEPYIAGPAAPSGTSIPAAVAQAAHVALVALYPSQQGTWDAALEEDLAAIPDSQAKTDGIELGRETASLIFQARLNDGIVQNTPPVSTSYVFGNLPPAWTNDPEFPNPAVALNPLGGQFTPFAMTSSSQFRAPPPPALTSQEYADAFNEVKRLGGDGINTPTERTDEQTEIGIYWGYDGQPGLGTPVALYYEIAQVIARDRGNSIVENARLFGLIGIALGDSGISAWETKYTYNFWRPVTGIQYADAENSPFGVGDGNPNTAGDPTFRPLGAPADNGAPANFTPPFPAYISGHATFGGAAFQVLRRFYGTDEVGFTFISKEFDGITTDQDGIVRPVRPRTYTNLSVPEEENGQSRIYLGIHWAFDKTEGIRAGRRIADQAFDNYLTPR